MKDGIRNTTTVMLAAIIFVAICVGAYLGYWWLVRDTTQRAGEVRQETYGRQNALVEQVLDDIREAQRPGVPNNQYYAIVDVICDNAAKLNGTIDLPRNAQNFINQEC
ncbi:MAG: hypothetical protein ACWGQW_05050 [bacterium]